MTALQDWLGNTLVTSKSVRSLVCNPLRTLLPGKRGDVRHGRTLLRPGIERC
ncbi:MAG: hypothetical protein JST91_14060 [Actinobacteria bacterium]|nr:hypothetical protein [Actinomycetota bacterium]